MTTQRRPAGRSVAALLLALAPAIARAQDAAPAAQDSTPVASDAAPAADETATLRVRGRIITREDLNPEPSEVVGLDQSEENPYRPDLGLYRGARHGPAEVDEDELRDQLLRIYDGESITEVPEPSTAADAPTPRREIPDLDARSGSSSVWTALAVLGVVGIVAMIRIRRARASHRTH